MSSDACGQRRSSPDPPRPRILVVDDDDAERDALGALLRGDGFSTSTASDGAAAFVEARRVRPDVVVTDLTMPHMDGVELCRRLHELDPDLPVIVVTGHSDAASAIASLRAQAEDYLSKPVDLDTLVHRIERALERRDSKRMLAVQVEQTRIANERLRFSSIREHENAVAAERSRAQLGALLENLNDGVVIADRSGRVLMTNRTAHELWLGARAIGNVDDLNRLEIFRLDGTTCSVDDRPLTRALRGEVFERFELLCETADGDVRRLSTNGSNVMDEGGEVALAIVVFRDVTKLRRLERQRDESIALISHDLRGPLCNIIMSAQMIQKSTERQPPFEDTVAIVAKITRNATRMKEMIEELVESTALESEGAKLRTAPCDLRDVVASTIRDMDDDQRRRVVFEAGETPVCVRVERSKIERAIANLVSNAVKYSPGAEAVRVVLTEKDEEVVLEVVDRGIGIAAVDVPRLFERYFRAPTVQHFSGLGLGLYITGLIVAAHGGRIEVDSEAGKGSTFRLILPSDVAPS